MSRTIAYPVLALAAVALTGLANYGVYLAGEEWFVLRPDPMVVIRNVGLVVAIVVIGPLLIPSAIRKRSALTFLLVAASLFGMGSAMQFRLGHDVPRKLNAAEVSHVADSIRALRSGAPPDTLALLTRHAVRRANNRLRAEFEASRIDTRLARSLEQAYGSTPITREVLDDRGRAPLDNTLLRLLPLLAFFAAIAAITRFRVVSFLSKEWVLVGVWGSIAVAIIAYVYLKTSGGIRGASFAPQELLKATLPIAWAGLLVRYHDALAPMGRERFTRNPFILWMYILALLSAPLTSFILVRDFGQFLVIGIAQTLLLAWYTRSPLYVVLFTAAFIGSGLILVSSMLPAGVTLATALGIMAGAVVVLAWLERFRRRDALWTSASLVLAASLLLAGIVSRLPFMNSVLVTPRARFALFADLYSRNGDAGWWDRTRQVIEALYAQDAGGVFGRGLGFGTPFLIPNANSDYIFSALMEEVGLAGGILVIVAFLTLAAIGLRIASDLGKTTFAGLVVAALALLIGAQGLVHIAGNLNVLPMTGITLPLVSSGGSSMVVTWTMVGAIVALAGDAWRNRLVIRQTTDL